MIRRIKEYIKNVYTLMRKPEMLTLPSSLSYYFVLSIVPVVSLLLLIASNLNISVNYITTFFERHFSAELVSFITPMITKQAISIGFIIHTLIAFYIVSNGTNAIIVASNMIFHAKNKPFVKRRIKSFFLAVILIILFTFLLIVPVFGKQLLSLIESLGINSNFLLYLQTIYPILRLPLTLVVIYFGVKLVYVLSPDTKIKSRTVIKGSVFTTICWVLATFAFSYYTKNIASYNIYYAGLSSIVVLMIWFYFLAFIFVLGLSMNYQSREEDIEKTNTIKLKEIEEKVRINKMSN